MINLRNNIVKFKLHKSCKIVQLKEYLRAFPESIAPEAVDRVVRTEAKFLTGNKVDYLSIFDKKINQFFGIDVSQSRAGIKKLGSESLNSSHLYLNGEVFKAFEDDNYRKIGPYSIRQPFSSIFESTVGEYYSRIDPKSYKFSRSILAKAVLRVKKLVKANSLRPISLEESVERALKTKAHGLPYHLRGNEMLNGRRAYLYYYDLAASDLKRKKLTFIPSMMFMRLQPSGGDWVKHRIAFGIAHHVNYLEGMIQKPLLEHLVTLPQFSENAGPGKSDSVITNIFSKAKLKSINLIGFDASGYDKSICIELLEAAFGCIKYWFDGTLNWLIDDICRYTYSCDLVCPLGVVVDRNRGVASGTNHTNLVDSIIQLILHEYVVITLGVADSDYIMPTVQGDDGVWAIYGLDGFILSKILKDFNITVNPSKVSVSQHYVTFCQRLYISDYKVDGINVGIRSVYRTLNSIVSFERKRHSGWRYSDDIIRCIMQLEEMRFNPCFDSIVRTLCRVDDKYGLGSLLPNGIDDIIKMSGSVDDFISRAGGSSWDQEKMRQSLTGIHKFHTVKLIKGLS